LLHPDHEHEAAPHPVAAYSLSELNDGPNAAMQIMNMKPHEILSLLEEASGTKLYERKKDSAMKTLSKKQTKLDEIDEVGHIKLHYITCPLNQ
jgi:hypothetical protein